MKIDPRSLGIGNFPELPAAGGKDRPIGGAQFGQLLKEAMASVDALQKDGMAAETSFARGENVELHDVLIKIEEAEVAYKTMIGIRNKLVDAYREIVRMGV